VHCIDVMNAVARLSDLHDWELVGAEVESFRCSLAGTDGFTKAQALRMTRWANAWEGLPAVLREFYSKNFHRTPVSVALYSILENRKLQDWQRLAVERVYKEHNGYMPQIEIVPRRAK